VRLNVQLSCHLANVPPAAADAFKASADRLFNAALERVKELAAAYADAGELPRAVEARDACRGRHSMAARAARAVSEAGAGTASVLIVADSERAEAERLVGAHRASVGDRDPLAPVVVAGQLAQPVVVWRTARRRARRMGGLSGGGDVASVALGRASARPVVSGPPAMAHRRVERARPYR
jgi:hypothetical protein